MKNVINVKAQREEIIYFIRKYFLENGPTSKAVIGISGGKDSAIAAALLVDALGADRVIGVLMPQNIQKDIDDSSRVCIALGIEYYIVNIGKACEALYKELPNVTGQVLTNTPARIRMTTLYAIASAVGGRVCNTSNRSETYLGYCSKWADNVGDFSLFKNLCVRDVMALGDYYVERHILPRDIVYKSPADGLSGKSDEENMGITYEVVDAWILDGEMPLRNKDYVNMETRSMKNRHKSQAVFLNAPMRKEL